MVLPECDENKNLSFNVNNTNATLPYEEQRNEWNDKSIFSGRMAG